MNQETTNPEKEDESGSPDARQEAGLESSESTDQFSDAENERVTDSPEQDSNASGEASEMGLLDEAKKEIQELKDSWMRERAEFTNYKKRMSQEQIRIRGQVAGNFVKNLLPVLDNLERVLQVETDDPAVKNFVTGVEMIQTEFRSVLEKEGIRTDNPVGADFDPGSMEAIAMEDREGLEKETVLEVYQEGYYMTTDGEDRQVLRPARVKVGKPA